MQLELDFLVLLSVVGPGGPVAAGRCLCLSQLSVYVGYYCLMYEVSIAVDS